MAPGGVVLAFLGLALVAHAAIHFPQVPFPFTNEEKHSVLSTKHAVVGKGTVLKPSAKSAANKMMGGWQLISRSAMPNTPGDLIDFNGKPLMKFTENFTKSSIPDWSVNPDYISLIPRKGNPGMADLLVHFEAPNPATVYHIELLVGADGSLTQLSYKPVDFSAWQGVWTPCAGSMTPWGSHLGSEEYEPDARAFYSDSYQILRKSSSTNVTSANGPTAYGRFFGLYPGDYADNATYIEALRAAFNPYYYGFLTEISIDDSAKAVARKWYSTGRVAIEMGIVMPDLKTVYVADDGANVGFYKFVSDKAQDLSKGRLYAAKFNQTSADNGGDFQLTWVDLGTTDHDTIAAAIPKTNFSSIFEYEKPANGSCPAGFKAVKHSYGEECLKLVEGAEMLAAALETRRYAAYLGATTEWNKWEGITYDSKRNVLYTAMSDLGVGTNEEPTRVGGMDDVRVAPNKCGCVYTIELDASFNANRMHALVCGKPDVGVTRGIVSNNTCSIEGIANPDNVAYHAPLDVLLIAEDSGTHENNFMWWYNMRTHEMTRVLSSPMAAEITGVLWSVLPNGATYIIAAMQHPLDEKAHDAYVNATEYTGTGGYIGYFGPFFLGRGETLALSSIPAPTTLADKMSVTASTKAVIGQYVNAHYDILERTGDVRGNGTFGMQLDQNMEPVKAYIVPNWTVSENASLSPNMDFSSLTSVCDKNFMTTQFEHQNPATMYVSVLQQAANGSMDAVSTQAIDWSAWGGLYTPCAGSISPWGTRMGSEEFEPDARIIEQAVNLNQIGSYGNASAPAMNFTYEGGNVLAMVRHYGLYYGDMTLEEFHAAFKPYKYGFITEVKIQYDGSTIPQKHYMLGRVATEMAYVMPDRRTVYTTDDGANVGFFKFVADKPGDLSAGSLYAYKATQMSAANGGVFRMDWVWLGHSCTDELLAASSTLKFSDIWATAAPNTNASTNGGAFCPAGYTSINQGGRGCECVMLKPGMEKFAAFFETRRYAAYLGATTEFSKWEGITYDSKRNVLYTSMSDVRQGMEDNKNRGRNSSEFDVCGPNHLRLEYNRCGCVYRLYLDGTYSAYKMDALICGTPLTNSSLPGWVEKNNCHIESIASPDNVAYIAEHDTLIIGEDTSEHQNDAMWQYDMDTGSLTRIFTTPYGSETTSPYWFPNVNGFAYLAASVQHPYGESDIERANETAAFGVRGAVGLIGPFPASAPGFQPSESCARDGTWAVAVQVEYDRSAPTPEDLDRLDAYVLARIDNLLALCSGNTLASRVASRQLEGGVVVAHVQFDDAKKPAQDFKAMLTDPSGEFQTLLAATFGRLSATAGTAVTGYEVSSAGPLRVSKTRAYTPPTARIA